MAHSYVPENYSPHDPQTREFRRMVNATLIDAMIHFKQVGRLSKEQ